MKQHVWFVDLELHFPNTLSNAKMAYVSNVDLDEWNNLGIHDFLSWDRLGFRKLACSCQNFKIQNLSGSNFLKWKVNHYNKYRPWWVCIHDFCSWDHLGFGQSVFFKSNIWLGQTWSNEVLNDLKWKTFAYQDCRTHQDLQTCYPLPFHLKSKPILHCGYNLIFFKFKFWVIETKSNDKITIITFVHLDVYYKCCIDIISIWHHLLPQKYLSQFSSKFLFKKKYYKFF
jgi:hypothetical protein